MASLSDPQKVTVLVLAASRAGPQDAVAKLQNVSHKCLVEIDGEIMLHGSFAKSRKAGMRAISMFRSRARS